MITLTSLKSAGSYLQFLQDRRCAIELARLGLNFDYNDKNTCAQLGYLRQSYFQNANNSVVSSFIVSPNPTNATAYFTFNEPTFEGDILRINSLDGKQVMEYQLNSKIYYLNLDVSSLNSSVYIVSYIHNQTYSFNRMTILR